MIPNHILNDLGPDDRVAVLTRGNEVHFHVHPVTDTPDAVRAVAEAEGSQVLRSHLHSHEEIRAVIAARDPETGGQG